MLTENFTETDLTSPPIGKAELWLFLCVGKRANNTFPISNLFFETYQYFLGGCLYLFCREATC